MGSSTKVRHEQGGKQLTVASGGLIKIEDGGSIILSSTDPHVVGALWNNSGTIAISAG